MIIEAENRFRKNLYQCLQQKGFTVDKVTPQDDVETIFAKEKIDVVLLGVDGLGMKGLSLIRPLKTISPMTEIIIINDSNHMDLSIEGMDLGAFDDFLIPIDIDSLAKRIREAVMRKNQR
ncbi:MAG: response regulator transcription factor [Deltaproteobacteria bacterium]|nr:response regulator transcription factor [Deltaproteobacteria bacterium]